MSVAEFALLVFTFNALALGNGPIMVSLFRDSFVEGRGVLTVDQLLSAFAIGQITPGQANLYVATIGYQLFGIGGALLAVLVIVVPGYLMLPLVRSFERFRNVDMVRRFVRGLTCASVGLIFAATAQMARQALTDVPGWAAFLLTLTLAHVLRWNTLLSLATATGVGILLAIWI
jgi:chromate transporter